MFKIILVGNNSVGKTSIISSYFSNVFYDQYKATIGIDLKIFSFKIKNKLIKLQIFDTAGQERFRSIVSSYYKGSHGVILVYDITQKESFEGLNEWYETIKKYANNNVQVVLVGNKVDLDEKRAVNKNLAKQYAQDKKMLFFETSAKENLNLEQVFTKIAEQCLEIYDADCNKNSSNNNSYEVNYNQIGNNISQEFEVEEEIELIQPIQKKVQYKKKKCC